MDEFTKMVEAYSWSGDKQGSICASLHASPDPCNGEDAVAGSTPLPRKKGDRGGSSSSLLQANRHQTYPHDVHMHRDQIEPKTSVSDYNKDVGSVSFSPGWYRPGQKHLLMKEPRGATLRSRHSSRQLVFSIEDMDVKLDAEGSVKSKVKIKKERKKKRRWTEEKQGDKQARSKQDSTEVCNMLDFYDDSECEDGAPKIDTVKKGKKALSNMLISKLENEAAMVKTYTRKRKKEGPVASTNDVDAIDVNEIKQSSHYRSNESSDRKHAEGRSAQKAVVCLGLHVVPCKATSKVKTSAYFTNTVKALGQRDIANKTWVPPVSVHALIQEELYQDPWKVLVACMLLNKTCGTQMRRVIWDLFSLCPTPGAAIAMETDKIEDVIRPLGLQKKRARMIQKFSKDYLGKEWSNVGELHGIGKYATDAYAIFCEGRWREVKPEDHMLNDYWKYLCDTDGLGYAFKDDRRKSDEVAPAVLGAES